MGMHVLLVKCVTEILHQNCQFAECVRSGYVGKVSLLNFTKLYACFLVSFTV